MEIKSLKEEGSSEMRQTLNLSFIALLVFAFGVGMLQAEVVKSPARVGSQQVNVMSSVNGCGGEIPV
jgi:hypothetical protein